MDPYEALGNAVVKLAVKDYSEAYRHELLHPGEPRNVRSDMTLKSLEDFFHSELYYLYTDLDAEFLMSGARRVVKEKLARELPAEHARAVHWLVKHQHDNNGCKWENEMRERIAKVARCEQQYTRLSIGKIPREKEYAALLPEIKKEIRRAKKCGSK